MNVCETTTRKCYSYIINQSQKRPTVLKGMDTVGWINMCEYISSLNLRQKIG